nr:MAG TPA: hypothetical protein [Caudoviricetes sp.]
MYFRGGLSICQVSSFLHTIYFFTRNFFTSYNRRKSF